MSYCCLTSIDRETFDHMRARNESTPSMAHPHPDQQKRFWALSYFTLRNLKINEPFLSYCRMYRCGNPLPTPEDLPKPTLKRWSIFFKEQP